MPGLLSNFTANMPGFNGPTPFSSETGVDPMQGTGGKPNIPMFGVGGMGMFGGGQQQPPAPPPTAPPPQAPVPQIGMPPPPPIMPQGGGPQPGMPNSGPSTSAMNQALMNQLKNGATGMQAPSPLVSQDAAKVGTGPSNYVPMAGA